MTEQMWCLKQTVRNNRSSNGSDGQRDAMIALLRTLVNTNSGSYDKPGVDAVGGHIRNFFGDHGIATEVTPDEKFGDAIAATVGQAAAVRQPADPADGAP